MAEQKQDDQLCFFLNLKLIWLYAVSDEKNNNVSKRFNEIQMTKIFFFFHTRNFKQEKMTTQTPNYTFVMC